MTIQRKFATAWVAAILGLGIAATASAGGGGYGEETTRAKKHAMEKQRVAGQEKTGAAAIMEEQDLHKHLVVVNAHVADAVNDVKALTALAQMDLERGDQAFIEPLKQHAMKDIDMAITHLSHVKQINQKLEKRAASGAGETTQPVAGTEMPRPADQEAVAKLERSLKNARSALGKVDARNFDQLQMRLGPVATEIQQAQQTFGQIATEQNLTQIEKIDLERLPVRGAEPGVPGAQPTHEQPLSPQGAEEEKKY